MLGKIVRITVSIIALVLVIYFHYSFVEFGLKIHLTYTLAMILPYVLEFFFVCSVLFQVYTHVIPQSKIWIRRLVAIVILCAGCGIAFYFHPIYQGDFGNTYQKVTLSGNNQEAFQQGLTLVVLPGCPHCHNRFMQLKFMSDIYPSIPIQVLVVNKDTSEVEEYRELSKDNPNIQAGFFPKDLIKPLQIIGYPILFYTEKTTTPRHIIKWDNNGFGAAAWDYVLEREGL